MKYSILMTILATMLSHSATAVTLKERDSSVYNYDVLFTNPTCAAHDYKESIRTQGGDYVRYTPENVFCSGDDKKITAARDGSDDRLGYNESPQYRLLSLINDKKTEEIFMSFLSFSDSRVARALCKRMQDGMKLELIIDKKNEQGSIDRTLKKYLEDDEELSDRSVRRRVEAHLAKLQKDAKEEVLKYAKMRTRSSSQENAYKKAKKTYERLLTKSQYLASVMCSTNGTSTDQDFKVHKMEKKRGIGWSHTKVIMINPGDRKKVTVAFASANMSSGTTIHHENWHFVTAATQSHFVQIHKCLRSAEFYHSDSRNSFKNHIKECRKNIVDNMNLDEEEDIKVFIAPGEGEEAVETFTKAIRWSKSVDLAAHRFTLNNLKQALKNAIRYGTKVRMVFDDDMYLVGKGILADGLRVPNMSNEYRNVLNVLGGKDNAKLYKDGVEARYMQTNHFSHTIHHNKYLILDNEKKGRNKPKFFDRPAVFCGAGNFTKAAFMMSSPATNLENYYYITIPEVVEAFKKQYDYKWNNLATAYDDLPVKDVKPRRVD